MKRNNNKENIEDNYKADNIKKFLVSDIIGMDVINENTKIHYGNIINIIHMKANDVFVVKNSNRYEFMLPAVEEFIKKIDLKKKEMLVDPIEGLFDLY